mgnify:CR=1 FL=1
MNSGKGGRPREYRNAAEKQKAYRERQKVVKSLLEELEADALALRNRLNHYEEKGEYVYIQVTPSIIGGDYAAVWINRYFRFSVNIYLINYMVSVGDLIADNEDHVRQARYFLSESTHSKG